ncbi:hypothetical protein [Nocardia sp. NPDC005366]|uniref:hypothetical protein n=1 Tax=Nocardia sp. NPDC005366 TaxID=3156878 RepID=UPI0033B38D20
MPHISLSNPFPDKIMKVWVEPWGEDFWMRHDDALTVEFEDADFTENIIREGQVFDVHWLEDGMVVWVAALEFTVRDQSGAELRCGHQRPEDIDQAGKTRAAAAKSAAQQADAARDAARE